MQLGSKLKFRKQDDEAQALLDAAEVANFKAESSVGAELRRRRLAQGLKSEEIAETLRISKSYIEGIEESDAQRLPERVYTLGYVRSYAKLVGCNPQETVQTFKEELLQETESVGLQFPEVLVPKTNPKNIVVIGSSLAVVILLAVLYFISGDRTESPEPAEIPENKVEPQPNLNKPDEAPENEELPPEEAQVLANETEPDAIQPSPPLSKQISLKAIDRSWIEVKDAQGKTIANKTLAPGERFELPEQTGLELWTGNAGGLQVIVGDSPPKTLGAVGEIKRKLSLDFESLRSYLNQR